MKAYASMAVAVLNGTDPATVGTVPTGADFPAFAEVVRDYAGTLGVTVPVGYRVEDLTPPDTLSQSDEDAIEEAIDYWDRSRMFEENAKVGYRDLID